MPTTLQEFFPRSMPRIMISIGLLLSPNQRRYYPIATRGAGHPIITDVAHAHKQQPQTTSQQKGRPHCAYSTWCLRQGFEHLPGITAGPTIQPLIKTVTPSFRNGLLARIIDGAIGFAESGHSNGNPRGDDAGSEPIMGQRHTRQLRINSLSFWVRQRIGWVIDPGQEYRRHETAAACRPANAPPSGIRYSSHDNAGAIPCRGHWCRSRQWRARYRAIRSI